MTSASARTDSRPGPRARANAHAQPAKPPSTSTVGNTGSDPSRCCSLAATNALVSNSGAKTPQRRSHSRRGSVPTHSASVHRPTAVAIRRCVCSTRTPPTMRGIGDPKQVGQSGQASPESVLVTSPPATMRTSVRNAAATARRRTHIGRQTPERARGGAFYAPLPSPCNRQKSNRPGLAGGLFGAVVLEGGLGGLAGLDGDFLGLGAVLLVPGFDRVFARGHVVDLERPVCAGHRLQAVLGNADVPAHPGMHVALPPHHAFFLGDVFDRRRRLVRHPLV